MGSLLHTAAEPSMTAVRGGANNDLFQALLARLPQAADRKQLEEATLAGLQLLLRRPEDQDLMIPMRGLVASITASATAETLPLAAERCIQVLLEAQRMRQPRKVVYLDRQAPRN